MYFLIDRADVVAEFAEVLGFRWDGAGFELFFGAVKASYGVMADYETYKIMHNLLLLNCLPDDAIDLTEVITQTHKQIHTKGTQHIHTRVRLHVHTQANKWMPSPSKLAKCERDSHFFRTMGMYATLSIGTRAFLRLGRDEEALETARIAVSVHC